MAYLGGESAEELVLRIHQYAVPLRSLSAASHQGGELLPLVQPRHLARGKQRVHPDFSRTQCKNEQL